MAYRLNGRRLPSDDDNGGVAVETEKPAILRRWFPALFVTTRTSLADELRHRDRFFGLVLTCGLLGVWFGVWLLLATNEQARVQTKLQREQLSILKLQTQYLAPR